MKKREQGGVPRSERKSWIFSTDYKMRLLFYTLYIHIYQLLRFILLLVNIWVLGLIVVLIIITIWSKGRFYLIVSDLNRRVDFVLIWFVLICFLVLCTLLQKNFDTCSPLFSVSGDSLSLLFSTRDVNGVDDVTLPEVRHHVPLSPSRVTSGS